MMGQGFGEAIATKMAAAWLISLVIAAVVGWAAIEGIIWMFHHVTVGVQ